MGERWPIEHKEWHMSAKAKRLKEALDAIYPGLCDEARQQMASELVRIIDSSIVRDYDLREATLLTRGAKKSTIGTRLQQLRIKAGLTQEQVRDKTRWHVAKVTRIESGRVPIIYSDLRFLLSLYGVSDPRVIEELAVLARQDHADRGQRRKAS